MSKGERQRADIDFSAILLAAGQDPFRPVGRVFEDIEVEPGRTFTPTPYRETWSFATEGGRRAARVAAEFDAFKVGRDLSAMRHFVLRPAPRRDEAGSLVAKASIGQLKRAFADFSADLDGTINKLVSNLLVKRLLTFVHVRFDAILNKWDLHAHCIWYVKECNVDEVFRRISSKFSTPWHEKIIKNTGALVNYCSQWVIDYRQRMRWPKEALLEFWNLSAPRLIRAGGEFAAFRRDLEGCALVREGDFVTVVKKPPRARHASHFAGVERDGVLGYARLRLDGRSRLCAIRSMSAGATPRAGESTKGSSTLSETRSLSSGVTSTKVGRETSPPLVEPTSSTGLSPPPPNGPSVRVRVPPSKSWIWNAFGTRADFVNPARPTSRFLLRHLAKLCPGGRMPESVSFELWPATSAVVALQRRRSEIAKGKPAKVASAAPPVSADDMASALRRGTPNNADSSGDVNLEVQNRAQQ